MNADPSSTDAPTPAQGNHGRQWLKGPWPAVILACVCFANSLPNAMVYDDESRILRNPSIHSLTNFSQIWLTDTLKTDVERLDQPQSNRDVLYRPLATFTFAINYALHGNSTLGYHALNVLLHALVCFLVWHLIWRLFADATVASLTAILFAVHPVHCEAVVYIVGRAEVLVALFILLGLLVLLPRQGVAGFGRAALAAPLFFLAMLAKESGFCYVPVALIVLHFVRKRVPSVPWHWWLMHAAILLAPLVIYLPLRYVACEYQLVRSKPFSLLNPLVNADGIERFYGVFVVLGHYVRLFLWPANMSVDYGFAVMDPKTWPDAMTWLGMAAAVAILVGLAGYLTRRPAWRKTAVLCAIWCVSYFVVSNAATLIATGVGESRVYWPSVAVFALLALGAAGLWKKLTTSIGLAPRASVGVGSVLVAIVLAAFGTRTIVRNTDWATSFRLFTKDAATFPQSAQLNAHAAQDYRDRAYNSDDPQARLADLEKANEYYERALAIFPNHWGFLWDRSMILADLGKLNEAIEHAQRAAELRPHHPLLEAALGRYLHANGQHAEAIPHIEEAVRMVPDELAYRLLLADALGRAGQPERAIQVLEEVAQRDPTNVQVRLILAGQLTRRDPARALRYAREARQIKPDSLDAALMLAEALVITGDRDNGIELYRSILAQLPLNHPLRAQVEQRIRSHTEGPTTRDANQP